MLVQNASDFALTMYAIFTSSSPPALEPPPELLPPPQAARPSIIAVAITIAIVLLNFIFVAPLNLSILSSFSYFYPYGVTTL